MLERITLSDLPYSKIKNIAESDNSLDFLDKEIVYPDKTVLTLGEYVFYFGLHNQQEFKSEILKSISAIKHALQILAKEFSDRREYNSYKHGLRIIPAFKRLTFLNAVTLEPTISWKFENSMTFYAYDKKTHETSYITKAFDSERDIRMTSICSNILWTMIKLRDIAFNKSSKDVNDKFEILFFGKEEIDIATETDVEIPDLNFSQRPIKITKQNK